MTRELGLLLHMYQPPWQSPSVLDKICGECYGWLTEWISQNDLKVSLNINYSLTKMLVDNKKHKIIDNIGLAAQRGVLEFTGSAAYHALLPLIPSAEIERQIDLNYEGNSDVFRGVFNPSGFFPPEMAHSSDLSRIVRDKGYDWIITDGAIYEHELNNSIPADFACSIDGLTTFFRSKWSNKFAMEYPDSGNTNAEFFVRELSKYMSDNTYKILSFDIETIGHHQKYNKNTMSWLNKSLASKQIKSSTVSEIAKNFPQRVELPHSDEKYLGSWSTNKEDIEQGNYFPLWNHPDNDVHKLQWLIANETIDLIERNKAHPNYGRARALLDEGLNSCQFWWADFGRFNPEIILKSSKGLVNAAKIFDESISSKYDALKNKVLCARYYC
jgi:predicted glycosyl hydrolase (DUF1957 family)